MFKVKVTAYVWSEAPAGKLTGVFLDKMFELPFAPYPQLALQVEKDSSRGAEMGPMTLTLEEVTYSPFSQVFDAAVSKSDEVFPSDQADRQVRELLAVGFKKIEMDGPPPRPRPKLVR